MKRIPSGTGSQRREADIPDYKRIANVLVSTSCAKREPSCCILSRLETPDGMELTGSLTSMLLQ